MKPGHHCAISLPDAMLQPSFSPCQACHLRLLAILDRMNHFARTPRGRFLAVSGILSVLLGVQTIAHRWSSDAWEHAAVIAELVERPIDPEHPLLPVEAPHPFMVPTAVIAARAVAFLGTDPLQGMVLLGILNLPLVLLGIWLFASHFTANRQYSAVWALLFTLLLWGRRPWGYSGFLHLNEIGRTLPYPSIFALGLTLISLSLYRSHVQRPRGLALMGLAVMAGAVIVSHPVASLFLGLGAFAVLFSSLDRRAGWTGIVAVAAGALIAATLWPYYPFFELYINQSQLYDSSNRVMYESVLLRAFPLLLGLILIPQRLRADHRDPLALMAVGLCVIYVAGFVFQRWSLGRVVSPLAFVLHVILADWAASHTPQFRSLLARSGLRGQLARATAGVIVLLLLLNMAPGLARGIPEFALPPPLRNDERLDPIDERQKFLAQWISFGDVVMATPQTGWPVPAFGGKILVPAHPQAFVDTSPFRAAVDAFFDPSSPEALRRHILRRYNIRWVLVDQLRYEDQSIPHPITGTGETTTLHDGLMLLGVEDERPDLQAGSP